MSLLKVPKSKEPLNHALLLVSQMSFCLASIPVEILMIYKKSKQDVN